MFGDTWLLEGAAESAQPGEQQCCCSLWSLVWCSTIQSPKSVWDKVRWDIWKGLFPVKVGRAWHRVPREAVAAPGSLEVSKARLDGAWSNLE